MPLNLKGRALHFVFKIPERKETMRFYREVLGMRVLRHEEFDGACEVQCNGPYDNRWSKTMIGYGDEDSHFVIELTYNYGVHSYERGNDFISMSIRDGEILDKAKVANWPVLPGNILEDPGGYRFQIIYKLRCNRDPVEKVTLASSDLTKSVEYWKGILGLTIFDRTVKTVTLGFNENQAKLEFQDIGGPIDRGKAYGRIAFSCPYDEQELLDETIKNHQQTILNPLTSLDTPGKATVRVIILADPDGHEICFVDDENYRKLSQPVPESEEELDRQIKLDNS